MWRISQGFKIADTKGKEKVNIHSNNNDNYNYKSNNNAAADADDLLFYAFIIQIWL